MKRPVVTPDPLAANLVNFCLRTELPADQRQAQLKALRLESIDLADYVDRSLLEHLDQSRLGLRQAQQAQAGLKEVVDKVLAPPWLSAIFMGSVAFGAGARAIVHQGGARRAVELAPGLKVESLHAGDQVFLNHELNVITGVSPEGPPRCGELGVFDRRTTDGQLVVNSRDEELVLQPAHLLAGINLQAGDLVRFDRALWMAFDKVANTQGKEFMLEEVPSLPRELLGGLDTGYEAMLTTLSALLVAPDTARRYGLSGRNAILLVGPPGCGKTYMTRIVASEIARLTGRRARFGVVKPAAWESPFVGVTQKAIRDTFKVLREAARDGVAFLFLDEIESIARTRGHFANIHSDKHLAALLAELDGFEDRKDIAIIAATNRKDLLDPALLARFTMEVKVERPDQSTAKAILNIHLPPSLPFSPNGELAAGTREEIIETAVSLLYAPNADNSVCRMLFRDNNERTIKARELVSGRLFQQLCENACRRAFVRELRGGERGLNAGDMEQAVTEAIDRLRTQLTPNNAHAHLADLPQDVDVVRVEPVVRKVPNAGRYLNLDPV
jgi:proteasome-associated ATPase